MFHFYIPQYVPFKFHHMFHLCSPIISSYIPLEFYCIFYFIPLCIYSTFIPLYAQLYVLLAFNHMFKLYSTIFFCVIFHYRFRYIFSNYIIYFILWVLFENRPALYFCNYILITAYTIYIFLFCIKDTV